MGFFDKMKETLTSTSTGVTQKINSTTDIMKCNTKIKNNEKEIEKLIYQVGSEHVSRHLFDDVSEHAALFDQIKALQAENQSITAEIERIKEEQENARLAEEARRQDAAMQRELAKRQQEAKIQQELKNMQGGARPNPYPAPFPAQQPQPAASAAAKFCPNCGQPNEADAMFCAFCGNRFAPAAPEPAAEEVPEVQEVPADDVIPANDDFLSPEESAPVENTEDTEM